MSIEQKTAALERALADAAPVLVAMSAGVDSCTLAAEAQRVLGDRARAVTVHAESTPARETRDAVAFAEQHGIEHQVVEHSELADPAYVRNDRMRCFHCRKNMTHVLEGVAARAGGATVVMGYTVSDTRDWRPGRLAAGQAGVRFPYIEADMDKDDVRALADRRGLEVADRPANACLSSRIPYGEPVTEEKLRQIETAEDALHRLGFDAVRVRHHGTVARIEVPPEDVPRLVGMRQRVDAAVRNAGFTFVSVDLAGYRSGSMNQLLDPNEQERSNVTLLP